VLAGAWTAYVIWYLLESEHCFTELPLDIGKVLAKMLTNCLRKLEREGNRSFDQADISDHRLVWPRACRAVASAAS
jgi:DNA-binding HxlR family transcriptional regulator